MMDEQIEPTAVDPREETRRPRRSRSRAKRQAPARVAAPKPSEFEGLTDHGCCDECVANAAKAVSAQRRLNELDRSYPRIPSPDRKSETVMESDAEWARRMAPDVREEFFALANQVLGHCVIQGGPGCAHPRKGGLSPVRKSDPVAVQRFSRAARALKLDNLR